MDAEIKNLWVEKLRDGTRVQGRGYLRTEEGEQCCLDVLCEVAVEAGVLPEPTLGTIANGESVYMYGTSGEYLTLPYEVQQWLGMVEDTPSVPIPDCVEYFFGETTSLTELNDRHYWTFEQIADVIEANL